MEMAIDALDAQTTPRAAREGDEVRVEGLRCVEPTFGLECVRIGEDVGVGVHDHMAHSDDGL